MWNKMAGENLYSNLRSLFTEKIENIKNIGKVYSFLCANPEYLKYFSKKEIKSISLKFIDKVNENLERLQLNLEWRMKN